MELRLDSVWHLCVDCVLAARAVLIWCIVHDIKCALAASVAVVVHSIGWGVTLVAGRVEHVLVCLLNVELGAPVAADLVGVAVLERVCAVIKCWHQNGVEGGDAATADLAQVNCVLEDAAEEVWLVVAGSVECGRLRQVHPIVVAV
jgi:hypothetical protein